MFFLGLSAVSVRVIVGCVYFSCGRLELQSLFKMSSENIICTVCKKLEADSNKLITCMYCFSNAHLKCRGIIGSASCRIRGTMYFCTPNCSEIYKRIIDMQNDKTSMVASLTSEIKLAVSAEMHNMRSEFKSIASAIESSQEFLSSKFDSIVSDFNGLKAENENLKKEIHNLRKIQSSIIDTVNKLEMQVNKVHVETATNNVMFLGLPSVPNENTVELVRATCKCVGVDVDASSIVSASRFSSNKAGSSLVPIKVVFKDRPIKELLLAKKKMLGKLSSTTVNDRLLLNGRPTNITIRDELPPLSLEMLRELRGSQERLNIKFIWTGRGGTILLKRDEHAQLEIIKNRSDVNRILGRNINSNASPRNREH